MLGDILLLNPTHTTLGRQLASKMLESGITRPVMSISGASGMGKTEIAHETALSLKKQGFPTAILHVDNYYRIDPAIREAWRREDYKRVGLDEINRALLERNIQNFRDARPDTGPCVDRYSDLTLELQWPFGSYRALILDGLYALAFGNADLRVFIKPIPAVMEEAQKLRKKETPDAHRARVMQREFEVIETLKNGANWLIDGDSLTAFP